MNTLSVSALSLLIPALACAAGPRSMPEPGAVRVELELGRPEIAALPAAAAAASAAPLETVAPSAGGLAVPASAVPGADAGAAQAETPAAAAPSADVSGERAALGHRFDGSAVHNGGGDSFAPEADFSQAVSAEHAALLREGLAAHGDSLAVFFDLMGHPRPSFLYVSHAREDSPGAAAVVTRVIYSVSGHSSRFDEVVGSRFWIGVDVRTKKIEFFTKDPADAAASAAPTLGAALRDRIVETFAALDVAGFPGVRWRRSMPRGVRYVQLPLLREGLGDGYAFTALVPAGSLAPGSHADPNAADHFIIRREGGLAGGTFYSSPIPLRAKK